MKNIVIAFVLLLLPFAGTSQILEPVKWSTSVKKISETEYLLISKATIDLGWHLYSQNVPDDGPIATTFKYDDSNGDFKFIGKTLEEEGHTIYDPIFEMKIKFFELSTTFVQKVEVDEGISLEGTWTIDPNLLSPLIFVLEAETYCNGCEDVTFYIPEVNAISALSLDYDVDCDDETELYTAFVYILNGVSPYSITGSTSANLNIDNFLIPNIPYGVPLEFFIEDGVGCKDTIVISDVCGVTLPVELLFFEGKTTQEGNLLQWQTASELNNDYFTLKRSVDGENFETIATVKGQGTTSMLQNYAFLDTDVSDGIIYYQLVSTNI